jgi:hypothetical protein
MGRAGLGCTRTPTSQRGHSSKAEAVGLAETPSCADRPWSIQAPTKPWERGEGESAYREAHWFARYIEHMSN